MSDQDKTFAISIVKHVRQMEPDAKSLTWEALTDLAATMSVKAGKKDGPGIVPCHLKKGEGRTKKTRGKIGHWRQEHLAMDVAMLCLDIEDHDWGTDDREELVKALKGLLPNTECMIYTTHSHGVREVDGKEKWKPNHPRLRVVLPLKAGVPTSEYPHLYEWARTHIAGVDRACSDPVRISFLPRKKAEGAELEPWLELVEGDLLDPTALPTADGMGTSLEAIGKDAAKERERSKGDAEEFAGRRGLTPDQVADALTHIEDNESYDMWIKIGMALHSYHVEGRITEEEGIRLWDTWSSGSENYESYDAIAEAWSGLNSEDRNDDRNITIGSLIHYAVEGGWSPPRRQIQFWRGDDVEIRDRILDDHYKVGERRSINAKFLRHVEGNRVGELKNVRDFHNALPETGVVHGYGAIWRYDVDSGVWVELPKEEVVNKVTTYAGRSVRTSKDKTKPLFVSASKGRSVYDLLEAKAKDEHPDFFDNQFHSIACKNAVLAVDNKDILLQVDDHRSPLSLGCRHRVNVEWDQNADEMEWVDFLYSCFIPGFERLEDGRVQSTEYATVEEFSTYLHDAANRIQALQKYVGASLFGRGTQTQKALMLVGPGGGGKSVFLKIIESLFREEDLASVPPQKMGEKHDNLPLATAALNICSDVDRTELLDTGTLKQVVVGDRIGFNRKYGDVFSHAPTCGHMFSCNELPSANDHSKGFWDRWLLISFPRQIRGTAEEEKGIVKRLLSNRVRKGVLAWAVQGFINWLEDEKRITIPQSSHDLMAGWQEDSNPVVEFIEAHRLPEDSERSRDTWTKASVLYDSFVAFCDRVGRREWTRQRFYKAMAALSDDLDFDFEGWSYRRTKYYPLRPMMLLDSEEGFATSIPSVPES